MKKALPILIVIVIISAGAWYYFNQPTTAPANTNQNDTANRSLSLTLAEQNQSGQSGTANVYEQGDKTKIEVILRNSPTDTPQPSHIHTGSCAAIGGVKYPLSSLVNGESTTTLDVSYNQLLTELPLAINVHKSAAESGIYVACADIKAGSDTSSTMPVIDGTTDEMVVNNEPPAPPDQTPNPTPEAKNVNLTAKMFAFSQTELRIKKGDTVTINFSSTGGLHDWVIDEFNARTKQVNPGEPTSVTFTADEAGTFEYYCSVGNHRAMGMKGNLIVE